MITSCGIHRLRGRLCRWTAAFFHGHAKAFVRCRLLSVARTIGIEEDTDRIGRELPRGKLLSTPKLPCHLFANHAAPCGQALGGMLLHPLIELRRALDCIEASAKSEVVTVCSWQFAGEERLQSTAIILITTGEPYRYDGYWRRWPDDLPVPCPAA